VQRCRQGGSLTDQTPPPQKKNWHGLHRPPHMAIRRIVDRCWPTIFHSFFFFFFFLDFGLSQLTSLQFIHCHVAGFFKPTIPQSPPSHLQDYSKCNNARLEFSTNFFVPSFDPIEWCLKNGLHSGGSNSQPFSHESSALTTRPRLLFHSSSKIFY
jgi:hypothetical protein